MLSPIPSILFIRNSEFTYSDTGSDKEQEVLADKSVNFLVSAFLQHKNELLDLFDIDPQSPTASASTSNAKRVRMPRKLYYHISAF